jgi:hypothetical protein
VRDGFNAGGLWVRLDELPRQALPTLMKKVVAHAREKPLSRKREREGPIA